MKDDIREALAGWIAEAIETGQPIAPLPAEAIPGDAAEGEDIAGAVLAITGLTPCGLRLAPGAGGAMLAGPMIEARLLRSGATLPMAALRHARVSAAAIGVLAAPLDGDGTGDPAFAAVHAALDVATSRFRDGPANDAASAADLADLGFVVAGPKAALPDGPALTACAIETRRPKGAPVDLAARFRAAADAARAMGGLPQGAVLVVAGLSPPVSPGVDEAWAARIAGLGRARARFSA